MKKKIFKKALAFTLAEVLITLSILGVVAAITVPSLIKRNEEKSTVTKLRKFYSALTEAYAEASIEQGPISKWGLKPNDTASAVKVYDYLIKPYFKVAKFCGKDEKFECLASAYNDYGQKNQSTWFQQDMYQKVLLADGTGLMIVVDIASQPLIYYDTNGKKGPNEWARDMFMFGLRYNSYDTDNFSPTGLPQDGVQAFDQGCPNSGGACTAWAVFKGNLEYLHCNDLKWNGKNKCS